MHLNLIRRTAAPLCAALLISVNAPPLLASGDQDNLLNPNPSRPLAQDAYDPDQEQQALNVVNQQDFLQNFIPTMTVQPMGGSETTAFERRDDQGNVVFSYTENASSGQKIVTEGSGRWTYADGRLVSYESPDAGVVRYVSDAHGSLVSITQTIDTVTYTYDASGRIRSADSSATHWDYVLSGVYQGYIDRETDKTTQEVSFYEYTTAQDGTVSAKKSGGRAVDVDAASLSASSSRYLDRTLNPSVGLEFTFRRPGSEDQVGVTAIGNDPSGSWAVFSATADSGHVRIYWTRYDQTTGQTQTGEQTIDHVFDLSKTHQLKMSWENGKAVVDVITDGVSSRIYSLAAADWNPRFLTSSSGIDFTIAQAAAASGFEWHREYQLKNLDAAAPVTSRIRIDPAASSASITQMWSDPNAQISVWYDARQKRLNSYTSRYDAATNAWVYQGSTSVALNLTADVDYRVETSFAGGRIRVYVWPDGTARPDQPALDIAGLSSSSGLKGTLTSDGAALELLASGGGSVSAAPVRRLNLPDYGRDWVFSSRGIESYTSPADGVIRYQYDAADHLTGFTQAIGGTTITYDAFGTALTADSAEWHSEFIRSGAMQGYVQSETSLYTGETFLYSYTVAADGTVQGEKHSSRPVEVAGLSLSASSSRSNNRQLNPYLDVEFGFGDALSSKPQVMLSASAYDPLQRWALLNLTAEPDRIRVYWTGSNLLTAQSFSQDSQIDFAFDPAKTYRIRLAWANNEIRADLYADNVWTQRIYTLADAAWDPRFFVSSSDVSFTIHDATDPSSFLWNRSVSLQSLPAQAPSATATRVRIDPAQLTASFGQKWSDAARQITVRYDARLKRLEVFAYHLDAGSGQWVYESAAPVAMNLTAGLDYRTETRLENGRWLFYIWVDGGVKPGLPTLDLTGFTGALGGQSGVAAELFADGASIDLAGDTAVPVTAVRRILPLASALYRYYPVLASASSVWDSSGEYLNFFDQSADPNTGLPLSHIGNAEALKITHAYDVSLYILAGGSESEKIMNHLMSDSAFVVNPSYVPAEGIYSDLSQTGQWQPGFDRWNVHAGPNAWLGDAALSLYLRTGNRAYLDFALQRADFLKGLQEADGGLVMGPKLQFGTWSDIRSTENNFSALYFFENLARATQEPAYQTAADRIWQYVKTMYDPATHTFLRGERRAGGIWIKDTVDHFATDTVSWLPLERVLDDAQFGATVTERLAEAGRMVTEAETRTGVYRPDGQLAGFSFSPSSQALGVISIEWSLQFTIFYQKLSRAFEEAGDTVAAAQYTQKHDRLLASIGGYFVNPAAGERVAPYAVYVSGRGAYGVPTGHDFNTPSCDNACQDVYSLPSAYYKFAVNGVDPLRPELALVSETDYL